MCGCENHTHVCVSSCARTGKLKLLLHCLQPEHQSHQGGVIVREGWMLTHGWFLQEPPKGPWLPHPSLRALGSAATEGWWHCSPGGSFLASTSSTPRLSHTLHMLLTFQSISKPINFSVAFHRAGAQLRTGIFLKALKHRSLTESEVFWI